MTRRAYAYFNYNSAPTKKKKDKLKGIVSLIPFNQFRTLRR